MKKNVMKLLAVLLVLVMCFSLFGCAKEETETAKTATEETKETETADTNSEDTEEATVSPEDTEEATVSPEDFDTFVIGIAEAQANDETVIRRAYLENYIAPLYNVEFIFSEALGSDSSAMLTFIENCADSDADAIMAWSGQTDSAQMASVCEEYGMYYMYNGVAREQVFADNLPNFLGSFAADQKAQAQALADYLAESASEDGSEGFIICSMLAASNNIIHTLITSASLTALQDKYGLAYEDTIENLTVTNAPLQVANDKGLNILIYPGSSRKETWLPGLSAYVQTGDYGFVLSAGQTYTNSSVVIDEVERQFDKNIKVVCVGSLGESLLTAFNTDDVFGNPSIDFVTVKANSYITGGMFAMTYNALTGYADNIKNEDGTCNTFMYSQWEVSSPEQLATMEGWDSGDAEMWIFDSGYVDQLLGIYNPDLTPETYQAVLDTCTYESTMEKLAE